MRAMIGVARTAIFQFATVTYGIYDECQVGEAFDHVTEQKGIPEPQGSDEWWDGTVDLPIVGLGAEMS